MHRQIMGEFPQQPIKGLCRVDGCPHQGASLCGGKLEGEVIQCCAHGLRFNLNTGYLLGSTQLRVNRYPVERAGDQLHIVVAPEEDIPCTR